MIVDLKPYSTTKESGVPWLGRVPEHWDVRRGKNIYRSIDQRSEAGDEELLTVSSGRGVVPRRTANVTMFKAASYAGYKLCWPGDLVINSLWAWGNGLGVSRHHGIVSSAYGVYRLRREYEGYSQYFHELVRSVPFNWELRVRSKGVWISRLQLTDQAFLEATFPLPPPREQAAIVRFLDHADRRIRRYIRAKQKLIALLEEQKQAIIHRAVTRGLDPNVRLKPSGVEWLGDVPEHWSKAAIRQLAARGRSTFVNGPFGSDLLTTELTLTGVPVIYIRDISRGRYVRVSKSHVTSEKAASLEFCSVTAGDVLVAKVGDPPGTAATYPSGEPNGIVTQDVIRIRPDTTRIIGDYLVVYLNSRSGRITVGPIVIESTRGRVSLPDFKATPVVLPPLAEQQEILHDIANVTASLCVAADKARREIDLLREYRTRLIADVVTGKLDVREAATRLPEEVEEPEPLDKPDAAPDDAEGEIAIDLDALPEEAEA